mgnify:CR=1 FL=1
MGISAVASFHSPIGLAASSPKKAAQGSFETFFTKTGTDTAQTDTAKQTVMAPSVGGADLPIDSEDERAATAELLKLYKMLTVGKIDVNALNNSDTKPDVPNGPNRQILETLKTVLRRILGIQGSANNDNQENLSLQDLIDTLPAGMRDLLRKRFANLDELLQQDEANRKTRAKQTGSETT